MRARRLGKVLAVENGTSKKERDTKACPSPNILRFLLLIVLW
jgi:hypothetical protein